MENDRGGVLVRSALSLCRSDATLAGMRKRAVLFALLVLSACSNDPAPTAERMTLDEARALDQAQDMVETRETQAEAARPAPTPAPASESPAP